MDVGYKGTIRFVNVTKLFSVCTFKSNKGILKRKNFFHSLTSDSLTVNEIDIESPKLKF